MKRHSKHHTAKHMKFMKRRMLMGDTFSVTTAGGGSPPGGGGGGGSPPGGEAP